MEDLIACLYPYEDKDNLAREAVRSHENSARHVKALRNVPELPSHRSRESTASPDHSEDKHPAWHRENGLQLTFSYGPKAGLGFVLGTEASSCDIFVQAPEDNKVSRRHCYITFDAQRRLLVRDCSTHGTIVTYDKKGGEKRRNFTWIIGGHEVPNKTEDIVIKIHDDLQFQIVVSEPMFPDLFYDNVDRFRAEVAKNDELPFGALGLQSGISTAAASGTQTPEQREGTETPNENSILLKRKKLGQGTFSVVHHVWDVSTGVEYASKKFRSPEKVDWRKEASLMKQISHVSYYFIFLNH
jgi:serine/threonine-protein kinase Chk2